MSRHAHHKGLIGGLLASGGLLGLSYWLTGLLRLRGFSRAITAPVVVMFILSALLSMLKGH